MNERIKELASEAGIGQLIHVGHGEWDTKLSEKELKFAELIVLKCCKEIAQEPFNAGNASAWLKQHFGVEL